MTALKQFIKKHGFKIIIWLILLAGVVFILAVKTEQNYVQNPGLIPPSKNYDIQVQLTPEEEMELQTNIIELDKKIQQAIASGGQKIDLWSGMKGTMTGMPKMQLIMDKATSLKQLGKYNEAIKTMNEAFRKWYDKDINGRNYLGNLYVELKERKMALKYYERIIEAYPQNTLEFLPVIVATYIQLGDKETAGKNYIHYELSGGVRDENLMQGIRQLK